MAQLIIPQGISLTRKKGFRLDDISHALNGLPAWRVSRPSRFGNPFLVSVFGQEQAVALHEAALTGDPDQLGLDDNTRRWRTWVLENVHILRGYNLACWCKTPGVGVVDKCHRRILLQLANPEVFAAIEEAAKLAMAELLTKVGPRVQPMPFGNPNGPDVV